MDKIKVSAVPEYKELLSGVLTLIRQSRHEAARTVNALITATHWEIGRRLVEKEQQGRERAEYGDALINRLSNQTLREGIY